MDTFGGIGQLAARAICSVANHCRIRNDNDGVSKNQKRLAQKLRFANMKSTANQIMHRCFPPNIVVTPEHEREEDATTEGNMSTPTNGYQHQLHQRFLIRHTAQRVDQASPN